MLRALVFIMIAILALAAPPAPFAEVPAGARLTDRALVDQDGKAFRLSDLYGKPIVLSFVYTDCTHTCGTHTDSLKGAFTSPGSGFGTEFNALTIGFDTANDTPAALKEYGANFTDDFGPWRFATSGQETVDALVKEAGFAYRKTENGFDHPSLAVVIGPDGRVATRLYGNQVDPGELSRAIRLSTDPAAGPAVPASSGIMAFLKSICYTYDEETGTYGPDYGFLAKVGMGLVVYTAFLFFALYIFRSARKRPGL
ncbi:MAG: SCO family protein [Thermodesulfobacteriota bacterium]|nr:MAG: SCO family protein [Thermodesulfobacteriota bacterium]